MSFDYKVVIVYSPLKEYASRFQMQAPEQSTLQMMPMELRMPASKHERAAANARILRRKPPKLLNLNYESLSPTPTCLDRTPTSRGQQKFLK